MSYRNIAIIGKARRGKDTAGARLVQRWSFTRVAFADPLKEMALMIDPVVDWEHPDPDEIADGRSSEEWDAVHLSELVEDEGWERAKDDYPGVRRFLQRLGQTQREFDEDYWLRIALRKVAGGNKLGMPVVVTDVRYPNEAASLRRAGFILVRIKRQMRCVPGEAHESETALDGFSADFTVHNDSTLSELHAQIDALVKPL